MTTPVTVISGPDQAVGLALGRRLLGGDPGRVLLHHDVCQVGDGLVGRTTEYGDGRFDAAVVELEHGCITCTVRLDILPTLVALAGSDAVSHVVLVLPEVVEPGGFVEAFYGVVIEPEDITAAQRCHITRIVASVAAADLVDTLSEGLSLSEAGRQAADADDRTLSEVVVRQVEAADVIVVVDSGATERALLRLLNPTAVLLAEVDVPMDILPENLFDLQAVLDRTDPSVVPATADVRREDGAWSIVWRARGPLHPARLQEVLDGVVDTSLRSRGMLWLAGHPEAMVGWDGVGPRVSLGVVGPWLDGADDHAWDHAHPHHRMRAELDWHPDTGDRYVELVLTGVGDLPHRALDALSAAELTDRELGVSDHGRRPAPGDDPFRDVFETAHDRLSLPNPTFTPQELP